MFKPESDRQACTRLDPGRKGGAEPLHSRRRPIDEVLDLVHDGASARPTATPWPWQPQLPASSGAGGHCVCSVHRTARALRSTDPAIPLRA